MENEKRIPGRFFKPGNDARNAQRKAIESRHATTAWMLGEVQAYLRDHVTPELAALVLARVPVRRLWMALPAEQVKP